MSLFNDPRRVFNSDETAIYLNPKSGPVIAEKGQKYVYDVGQCNKENLTVLLTANAASEIAPPMALFSFERIPTAITAVAPHHWGIGRSPNGWMNSECFYEYMTNVFLKFLEDSKIPLPIAFIVDGHKSHLSLQLSEFCKSKGIILIALHPNTTHIMQPLDVCFFAPLKSKWKFYIDQYKMRNSIRAIQKHDVTVLLNDILKSEDFSNTLKNGFEACGLCPFNPDKVDYGKCVNRLQNEQEKSEVEQISDNPKDFGPKFLKYFESRIPKSMMNEFWRCHQTSTLPEDVTTHGLFAFWVDMLVENLRPEDIEFAPVDLADDAEPFSAAEIVEDDMELLYSGEIIPETVWNVDQALFTGPENVADNGEAADRNPAVENFGPSDNTDDLFDGMLNEAVCSSSSNHIFDSTKKSKSHVTSTPQENQTSPVDLNGFDISGDECSQVSPLNLTTSKLIDDLPHNISESINSSKSSKSVDDILSSITMYRSKAPSTEKKCRKKLILPSVMTCNKWIELQQAKDEEQMALVLKKEEKKKISSDKKRAREEKIQERTIKVCMVFYLS